MWKVSWLYEKVHNILVVPLYYVVFGTFYRLPNSDVSSLNLLN